MPNSGVKRLTPLQICVTLFHSQSWLVETAIHLQSVRSQICVCVVVRSRNNQHFALICTTPLFYILAPTCFGSMPSSGSFLDPSELFEIQIEWVVYRIMCGYVTCVPECRGSVCCASQQYGSTYPSPAITTPHSTRTSQKNPAEMYNFQVLTINSLSGLFYFNSASALF
jgi:hypothetical protein